MENVLLDRSTGSFELPRRPLGSGRRGLGARPAMPRRAGAHNHSSFFLATCPQQQQQQQYHHLHEGGAWSSAPALPYARPPPAIYSSPSLPLLPSNQPPLLPLPPLPPTATKYATFPCLPPGPTPPPPPRAGRGGAAAATTVPAATPAAARQRDRRRRPARPPPPPTEPAKAQTAKKKPLERATPLPPAPVVNAALDDLEQEVARNFVQDLLHALAPPPSSLPLPRFSLVVKALPPATAAASRVVAPAAPSCNSEAAAADAIRGLLRL